MGASRSWAEGESPEVLGESGERPAVPGSVPRPQQRFEGLVSVAGGGMGVVYKAWDRQTRAHVAIKVLRSGADRARFEREVRTLAALHHPNIVRYLAHGMARNGRPWLAMEWLYGKDLSSRLEKGPLSLRSALNLTRDVADGLACAHKLGLVHRDLKPANIFLLAGDPNRARVLDFGLARIAAKLRTRSAGGSFVTLTRTGMGLGTPAYMPIEQASDAKRADPSADIFSLGAVLFHCLTGVPPRTAGGTLAQVRASMISECIPSVRALRPAIPPAVAALVDRMLARDPERRPANGAALLVELARIDLELVPEWDTSRESSDGWPASWRDDLAHQTTEMSPDPDNPGSARGSSGSERACRR